MKPEYFIYGPLAVYAVATLVLIRPPRLFVRWWHAWQAKGLAEEAVKVERRLAMEAPTGPHNPFDLYTAETHAYIMAELRKVPGWEVALVRARKKALRKAMNLPAG